MARNSVGVLVGLVVAFGIVWSIESINYRLFPLPADLDVTDIDAMKAHMKTLPAMAFVTVLIAHFLGAMGAAWVASLIANSHQRQISLGIGLFLLIMGLITIFQIPHPVWFMLLDPLMYIPGVLIGYNIYQK